MRGQGQVTRLAEREKTDATNWRKTKNAENQVRLPGQGQALW